MQVREGLLAERRVKEVQEVHAEVQQEVLEDEGVHEEVQEQDEEVREAVHGREG